jgi:hypothetical protein
MASRPPPKSARTRYRVSVPRLFRRLLGLLSLSLLACSSTTGDGPCADGRLSCVGECVDGMKSLLHCGTCGNVCEVGEDCTGGQCTCLPNQNPCPSGCADVREDANNCGACGVVCPAGQVCSEGACALTCAGTLLACGMDCANLQDSVRHCGSCEGACDAGQACEAGVCTCTQGRADCGSGCTDVTEDSLNCGGCNVVCPTGQTCAGSMCLAVDGAGGSGSGGAATGSGGAGSGGLGSGGAASSGGAPSGGAPSGGGVGVGGTEPSGGSPGSGGDTSGCAATGFYVAGGMLYDANCNEFIMRGVNYPYAWYTAENTQADFGAIAATGANAVRIVLATGDRWTKTSAAELANLVTWAKAAQLIAVLEVHDVTGYAEQAESVPLSSAQSYWTGSDITDVLIGQEAYVLVNIGNEPNGNDTTATWVSTHQTAVGALRAAGLTHTLVVDAPNWGQDWTATMMNGDGNAIWDVDPEKNLVFSVHMYQEFPTEADVTTYYNTFLGNYEAPLIVGEFAADHGSAGDVAEAAIMSFAESLGIGYLGWSWSGNGSGLETLDITIGFDAASLSTWGSTLINGPNGLQETGEVCSIFQ